MSRSLLIAALAATATVAPVYAQAPVPSEDTSNLYTRKSLRAVRVAAAPSIDGKLDDAIWQAVPAGTGFIQTQPNPGRPASQKTEVRFAYDDHAVYVAARMFDTHPDSVVAQLARRDNIVYSDWIFVGIDSYYDRRTAFTFALNPKGVKVDLLLFDDTNDDANWDAVWDGAAQQDSFGWTAEFRIPLSQLRFSSDRKDATWGLNVMRRIARSNEESFWSPLRREDNAVVSAFGDLNGISGLKAPRRLELLPYTMSRLVRAPGDASNPYYARNDGAFGAGADLKVGVTSDLTLTATLNPDFGQVEADPSEVNLTAFETFFSEKRPFFVEGFDIFRAGIGVGDGDSGNEGLFYSRRIGRAPQGGVPGTAAFSDAPQNATILGAAKLSGKTKSGWSVGALSATTAREAAQYVTDTGARREAVVEPLTHYGVARVIKDLDKGQSAIGGIFTATNRDLPDELKFLRANAYSGGVNGRKRWNNGDYQLSGFLVGSRVAGDTSAINRTQRSSARYFQRPDNDHAAYDPTRTSLSGAAGGLEFMKMGGGHWRYAAVLNVKTPGFEVNDLGFMPQADQILQGSFVGYNVFEPGKHFNRWNVNVNQWTSYTFGGERTSFAGNINGNAEFKNTANIWYGVMRDQSAFSVTALRGGPAFKAPGAFQAWGGYDSDERKAVNWRLNMNYRKEDEGVGQRLGFHPGLRIRASNRLEIRLNPGLSVRTTNWQYVSTKSAASSNYYVFADLDQVTTSLTTRISYTFTPTLSLQAYAQPFISAGNYSGFKEVGDPRAARFHDRFNEYGGSQITFDPADNEYLVDRDANGSVDFALRNPDFNYRALRSNLVLRWEYRPGSSLFVVWSQGREITDSYGDFHLSRDADRLFAAPSTNVLLIKASYWFGL